MMTSLPPTAIFSGPARHCLAFLILIAGALLLPAPARAEGDQRGGVALEELLRDAAVGNQELLAAEFRAQQYQSRIALALNLDDSLLAYYYLGFPARILRESSPLRPEGTSPGDRAVTESIRGRALFERSTFMITSMAENTATWYRAVRDDLHLQLVRRIREDFFRLYFLDRIITVNETTLITIDNLLGISRERYAVGQLTQLDVLQIQTEKTLLLARLLELRQQRQALAASLNYLAGRAPAAPLDPHLDTELTHAGLREPAHSAAELTAFMLQNRPLVKGYRAQVDTFGIMRLMIPMYYNMALRQDALLEVESGMRTTRAEQADFQNKAAAEVVTEFGQLTTSFETATLYGSVLLPQARQSVAAAKTDFEVGRTDLRTPLQALINLNRFQSEYYQALANHQVALARLEAASAMPMF